jgi:hypothetical protein
MLKIVSEGDGRFRLLDASDFPMGWIAGLAIGFRGFVNELHARGAAALGWRALDTTLSGQYAGWPRRNIRLEELRLAHDGAYEWFHAGAVPVARLLRPGRRAYDASYGIEMVLPSYATEGVAIAAAQSVAEALTPLRDK